METLFTIMLFIFAITLIILVLIQPDRSHGMSASMGMGASNTVFGISKDGGPLAKATQVVAVLFIVSALLLYLVKSKEEAYCFVNTLFLSKNKMVVVR